MKKVLLTIHQCLSIVTLTGVIVEFFFAGMGIFHATSFQIHMFTGLLLWACSTLVLLFALLSRSGGKKIGFSALLFVLFFIQPLLLRMNQPFVNALHPVNGLAIAGVCVYLIYLDAKRTKIPH